MEKEIVKILFITDIHQNIAALNKLNIQSYDYIICGGDIVDLNNYNQSIIDGIIQKLSGNNVFIVPGNCDTRILPMLDNMNNLHEKYLSFDEGFSLSGIGFCKPFHRDLEVYRDFFTKNEHLILPFHNESPVKFILNFSGIIVENDKYKFIPFEEALENAKEFINKFSVFDENSLKRFKSELPTFENGILFTHSPPHSYLDKIGVLPNAGCEIITEIIEEKNPAFVLTGHFHELKGVTKYKDTTIINPGAFLNGNYLQICFYPESKGFTYDLLKLN